MSATSQALIILGLIFEFMSVFLTAWQAFFSKKQVKEKMIEKMSKTLLQKASEERIRACLTILFLGIGVILQGIAVFV